MILRPADCSPWYNFGWTAVSYFQIGGRLKLQVAHAENQIMSYAFPPDIRELIDQNMATGIYASEEDVLQAALHALSEYHATIADIRQGMIDYDAGRGEPLSDAMADIRRQMGSRL
jgi:Arc/MetJ-type ribon-helix-helix transcriptional regulator